MNNLKPAIEEEKLKDWNEFEEWLKTIWKPDIRPYSLFRGQSNSSWSLESSLERYCLIGFPLKDYFHIALDAKSQFETYTGKVWDIDSDDDISSWLAGVTGSQPTGKGLHEFPGYEYLIYLRHHGFPSPLLDWTESPYIAAFFAFQHARAGAESVSIFFHQPSNNDVGFSIIGPRRIHEKPMITVLGPYIKSHRRHFVQQTQYTICTKMDNGHAIYAPHEEAIASLQPSEQKIIKLTLPSHIRLNVLNRLSRYTINAYSLFQSEESLCETLAFKELSKHPLYRR
jgi:hypothetical protein